ncbi:unnamed protein product [Ectocarpus sp. CCAP 1310/34]|nr:unnamed protein product [Ectocarpus sp. CCAP 1310/34]
MVPKMKRELKSNQPAVPVAGRLRWHGYSLLENNPWAQPPESIVDEGAEGIRRYFEDLYGDPGRVQRDSIKIIQVGQGGAGKTSLRQSMKANQAAPTPEWKEESTVFADVESMVLKGTSIRVHDCAGQVGFRAHGNDYRSLYEDGGCPTFRQVAYTGLLQMFLTPLAVCVLVCNAKAFENPGDGIGSQVEKDCRMLEELCVGMQPVEVEDGVCLTSCSSMTMYDGGCLPSCCSTSSNGQGEGDSGPEASGRRWACDWLDKKDENPSPGPLDRLVNKRDGGLRGARIMLPRSWDIALTFLEALERGRDPVKMEVPKLVDSGEEGAKTAEPKLDVYQGITVEELRGKWQETVLELEKIDEAVNNTENALEGARSIREFDGSLVRHNTFVFLDVVWLAKILKPLLNHKEEETFDGLKREGILEPRLAQVVWPAGLCEFVLPTLASLGLTFPLENDPAEGLVVLLRLDPDRPEHVREVVDTFRSGLTPVLTAGWKIFLGVQPGAIEKVLTRCCDLGGVRTCWRSGVLVHGRLGVQDERGTFAVVVQYSSDGNELTAPVYGDRSSPALWTAVSFVSSVVRSMLLEFPGLRSRGFLECPQHGDAMALTGKGLIASPSVLELQVGHNDYQGCPTRDEIVYLRTHQETRAGDNLLDTAGCPQRSPEIGGQGAAIVELVSIVDVRLDRGVIFQDVETRFANMQSRYTFSRSSPNYQGEEALLERIAATVDRVEGGIQESLMYLKRLQAPNCPCPHLVEDMTLRFLCPVDMEKVPCGMNGEGYRFRERRSGVKKLAPVLQRGESDVDLSYFLQAVKDGLVEEIVDGALDEGILFRVANGDENAGADMQRDARASYEVLKEFMEKLDRGNNTEGLDGYTDFREKMQRVSDGRGVMVWLRTENVREWRDSLSSAAPSR